MEYWLNQGLGKWKLALWGFLNARLTAKHHNFQKKKESF